MDQLRALRVFLAVVEAEGFAPAGRRLGLSTSAVSRQVAELEGLYGVQLLNRTTRHVGLTEAGQRLCARGAALVEEAEALADEMATLNAVPRGHLRISAPPGIGDSAIAPRLPALLRRFPELSLEFDLSARFVDLVGEGYDAAIRAGALPDSGLSCRKLAEVPRVLCAAPDFLAGLPPLETPQQLAGIDCIAWRSPAAPTNWRFLDAAGGRVEVPVYGRFATASEAAERDAVRGGLGIGLFPASFAVEDFERGTLAPVPLPGFRPEPLPVYLVWPPQRVPGVKLRALIDHLVEALSRPDVLYH